MARRVEMDDRAQHQQRERVVQAVQRIARQVEEEDVAQAQHEPRHRHRQHREQANDRPRPVEAACLLEHVGADENERGAEEGRAGCQLQAIDEGVANFRVDQPEHVMLEARREVVRPVARERREHRHAEHREHQRADEDAVRRHRRVEPRCRFRPIWHRACAEHRRLLALHQPVDDERQHRGREQQQADDGAALEVLLADDELEHVGREHVEVAADHFRNAEVGHDEGEAHQRGGNQAVFRAGQGDREELASRAGAERVGRFVEARIGQRQRGDEDHQRMREHGEALGEHHAGRAVDVVDAEHLDHTARRTLVAEPVDQRNRRQQRRREQRDQGDRAEQRFERDAASHQCVGEAECERDGDQRDRERDPDAVPQRLQQGRRREIAREVGEAGERTVCRLE